MALQTGLFGFLLVGNFALKEIQLVLRKHLNKI